jgi:hypothetical protein
MVRTWHTNGTQGFTVGARLGLGIKSRLGNCDFRVHGYILGSGSGSEPELSIVHDGSETCIVRITKAAEIKKGKASDGDGGETRVSDNLRYVLSEA